jgi:hypothetical protein
MTRGAFKADSRQSRSLVAAGLAAANCRRRFRAGKAGVMFGASAAID